jgi:hypothetical protein
MAKPKSTPGKPPVSTERLASLNFVPTADPKVAGLVLKDAKDKTTGFLLGPDQLSNILAQALGVAATWASVPDLGGEGVVGPRHAVHAKNIWFEPGPSPDECVLRVVLAPKLEVTFLIPLNNVLIAIDTLTSDMNSSLRPRPH